MIQAKGFVEINLSARGCLRMSFKEDSFGACLRFLVYTALFACSRGKKGAAVRNIYFSSPKIT